MYSMNRRQIGNLKFLKLVLRTIFFKKEQIAIFFYISINLYASSTFLLIFNFQTINFHYLNSIFLKTSNFNAKFLKSLNLSLPKNSQIFQNFHRNFHLGAHFTHCFHVVMKMFYLCCLMFARCFTIQKPKEKKVCNEGLLSNVIELMLSRVQQQCNL